MKLHIGCGQDYLDDYINVDISPDVKADVYFDLESCADKFQLPLEENSIQEIQANHILEHIDNILPLMQELWRVAADGCLFLIRVPYGGTASAFDDPTHIRQFYETSWMYFSQPAYHRADYGYIGDWETEEIGLTLMPQMHQKLTSAQIGIQFAVNHLHNIVNEMLVVMRAVKPARSRNPDLLGMPTPMIQILNEDGSLPVQ